MGPTLQVQSEPDALPDVVQRRRETGDEKDSKNRDPRLTINLFRILLDMMSYSCSGDCNDATAFREMSILTFSAIRNCSLSPRRAATVP